MSVIQFRPARPDDLPDLHELARRTLTLDTFSRDLLAEKLFPLVPPDACVWNVVVAEAGGALVGFMQGVARPATGRAWLGLFAVDARWRRQRLATELFERVRGAWPAGLNDVEVLAIPGNYFTPGLDPRYTEAVCFLERLGFERFRDCVNLTADLSAPFPTAEDERRLAGEGVEIRRARTEDSPRLDAFFSEHFGEDWRFEAGLALANRPPTLHLALEADRVIAFSAHSTQNREWGFFGPMGTAAAARGRGVGRVLLRRCLNDLHAAGHRTALIPWVGPIAFYRQWAAARVTRVFWRYRLAGQ